MKYDTYDGYEIMYAHLNEVLTEVDEEVKANEILALVGNTGLSTGPHLHYTIKQGEEYIDPIEFVSLPIADYLD